MGCGCGGGAAAAAAAAAAASAAAAAAAASERLPSSSTSNTHGQRSKSSRPFNAPAWTRATPARACEKGDAGLYTFRATTHRSPESRRTQDVQGVQVARRSRLLALHAVLANSRRELLRAQRLAGLRVGKLLGVGGGHVRVLQRLLGHALEHTGAPARHARPRSRAGCVHSGAVTAPTLPPHSLRARSRGRAGLGLWLHSPPAELKRARCARAA